MPCWAVDGIRRSGSELLCGQMCPGHLPTRPDHYGKRVHHHTVGLAISLVLSSLRSARLVGIIPSQHGPHDERVVCRQNSLSRSNCLSTIKRRVSLPLGKVLAILRPLPHA